MPNFSNFSRKPVPQKAVNPLPALPPPLPDQNYVRVAPLDGGQYTEPGNLFVHPPDTTDPYAVTTVPALSFIIQHPGTSRFNRHGNYAKPCNILFDRGLQSNLQAYSPAVQAEIEHRRPIRLPDPIGKQLSRRGLTTEDIDLVALSHAHWAHTGDAADFSVYDMSYLVGPGTIGSFKQMAQMSPHRVDTNMVFPQHRTIELPYPGAKGAYSSDATKSGTLQMEWRPLGPLTYTIDLLGDGSVYVVDLPGHTQGHIGMLCRCGPDRWVLLAGDIAHDLRLLYGEKGINSWRDRTGRECCIHDSRVLTEETLTRLRLILQGQRAGGYEIEVILSHDLSWIMSNLNRFWPSSL